MKAVKGCVTILTDNVAMDKSETVAEHGFSAYVETDNRNFLFDTGQGKTVVHNAYLLEKDLHLINKIVLSHSHGDHTGGLPDVLRLQRKKTQRCIRTPRYFFVSVSKKERKENIRRHSLYQGISRKNGSATCLQHGIHGN